MSMPIVTTDAPGCKDVVTDGINGFLCEARNAKSLENSMRKVIALSTEEIKAMGNKGREIAISQFDLKIVISKYKSAISTVMNT